MSVLHFSKYHGAGNDFIMVDDRTGRWGETLTTAQISQLCHRRFGIGADGLILVQESPDGSDFFMRYFNADGRTSTFCGNGGRCIVAYAGTLGLHTGSCSFLGTDGMHHGYILPDGRVMISMTDVEEVNRLHPGALTLYTGSPHYVTFTDTLEALDVVQQGRAVRYGPEFGEAGINVNFVQAISPGEIRVRTYERGVEDETFACGTGVVAAAIATCVQEDSSLTQWQVQARGGDLLVDFERKGPLHFAGVRLTGPAVEVFTGSVKLL